MLALLLLASCTQDARWQALNSAAGDAAVTGDVIDELLRMADDPRPQWRAAAQRGLDHQAERQADQLVSLLCGVEAPSPEYRGAIKKALARSGAPGARALVSRWLDANQSNARELGTIVAAIGAPALPVLEEQLADGDMRRRAIAAWTAGEMGTAGTPLIALLIERSVRDELPVSRHALTALAKIAPADPRSLAAMTSVSGSDQAELASAAQDALARCAVQQSLMPAVDVLRVHGRRAVEPAVDAMKAGDSAQARLAAGLLAALLTPEFEGLVATAAKPADLMREVENDLAQTRALACLQLAVADGERDARVAALRTGLRDGHPAVAHCARVALLRMGEQP